MKLLALIALLFLAKISESARILGIVASPSYSHQIVYRPIWKELVKRGHQVVVITTDPMKDPNLTNLTEIDVHHTYEVKRSFNKDMLKYNYGLLGMIQRYTEYQEEIAVAQMGHPSVQKLLRDASERFDLVMFEYFLPVYSMFGERFGCPTIALSSIDLPIETHGSLGNPLHLGLYSSPIFPFYRDLTLKQKLINFLYNKVASHFIGYTYVKAVDRMIQRHFGEGYSDFQEVDRKIDLFLVNTNPAFSMVKPLVPAIVEFGAGVHIQPQKALPKEVSEFLDGPQFVVYFSLGSNVLGKYMSTDLTSKILSAFSKLPYKVLWKFEETIPDLPKNVKTIKWAPQQDILRHPNVKAFISQCGYQSLEEALYTQVPLIAMPFYGDQIYNAKVAVDVGIGVFVDKDDFTEQDLIVAITEVINNTKYKEKALELSKLSRDQPIVGVDKAVWWIEYVLRHKGAKHLRSPIADLPFYQYYMLDVWGVIVVFLFVVYNVIKFLLFPYLLLDLGDKLFGRSSAWAHLSFAFRLQRNINNSYKYHES